MKVKVYRYNPETDDVPDLQEYDVESPGERDLIVLDVLERLADLHDPFSVFRCRAILNCVAFCPKKLNPRNTISQIQGLLLKKGS